MYHFRPPQPAILSGFPRTCENKDSELLCPICFELLDEASITKCGHSFCRLCLEKAVNVNPKCPKCGAEMSNNPNEIWPNFALNGLASKERKRLKERQRLPPLQQKRLDDGFDVLSLAEIDILMDTLAQRRTQIHSHAFLTQKQLLKEFLSHLKKQKDNELFQLQKEAAVISRDLETVEVDLETLEASAPSSSMASEATKSGNNVVPNDEEQPRPGQQPEVEGFNVGPDLRTLQQNQEWSLKARRQRMHQHFDDLAECYFTSRTSDVLFPPKSKKRKTDDDLEGGEDEAIDKEGLNDFSKCLSKFTRYSKVRPMATLSYTADIFNNASIVSSIEFDKDNEYFAIAGVTKRIKVYDYNVVLKDMVDIHYPNAEMTCSSKISCVAWNSFIKSSLASSDYEGSVVLWDANVCQKQLVYQEHEKRCWSVDFNLVDTRILASGSDDARVKLWSTNVAHSVATLEAKANVCCVKFNPKSCYHLAFGSADHCVHSSDLRSTKAPLCLLKGHRKAVSYVKFLDGDSIVSASTDSQLKLWSLDTDTIAGMSGTSNNVVSAKRSFHGHYNEKNFVGLATDGDFVTCGSENNSLYVYYKGLSRPLFSYKFEPAKSLLEARSGVGASSSHDDSNEFVSAVCWRPGTNVIVGANSQGSIKLLELI